LFLVRILPALLVLWITFFIEESQAWLQSDMRRREAREALIVEFGGFSRRAMIFACIYILGS